MTNSLDVPSSAAGQPPAAKPSPWSRLAGVFVSPVETMRDVALRPDILVPLLLMVVVSLVATVVMVDRIDFASAIRTDIETRTPDMPKEDAEKIVRFGAAFAKMAVYASPVLSIAILAAIGGIFLLAFRLFGGEGNFKSAFAIATYAWYPLLVKSIITLVVMLSRDSVVSAEELATIVQSNPGVLVDMREQRVLFALLSSFDLFTIWVLLLMTFGYAAMSRFSKRRAAAIVFGLWAAMVLLKTGLAALGSMG